jgi:hypothetical protein
MCSDHRTKVAGAPIAVLCLTAKNQVPFELPVFKRLKDCSGKSRLFAGIIGEKGAAIIANSFATVEEALEGARNAHDNLAPALAKKIIAGSEYLKIAPTLVRVARDVPLPKVDLALPKAPTDLSSIYQFKERYALGASVDRLISALGW